MGTPARRVRRAGVPVTFVGQECPTYNQGRELVFESSPENRSENCQVYANALIEWMLENRIDSDDVPSGEVGMKQLDREKYR